MIRIVVLTGLLLFFQWSALGNWPRFRGPNGSGVAEAATPPVRFGPGTNLLWKVPVPPGRSSPVVWGDHLFLTAFENDQLLTLAYDTRTGKELWRRVAPAERIEEVHEFSSPAAPTPCADGERVYTYFGSYGLIAYDVDGKEIWRHPLESMRTEHGTASSPIRAGNQLILQHDGESVDASVMAIDPATGEVLWMTPRPLAGSSHSTPMLWYHDGVEELILQGKGRVSAYGLDGEGPKWWVRGWTLRAVTTPVAGLGLLFAGGAGSGDPKVPIDAVLQWSHLIRYDSNQDQQLALEEIPEDLFYIMHKEIPATVQGNSLSIRWIAETFADKNPKDGVVTEKEWSLFAGWVTDKYNADRFVAVEPGGVDDSTETKVVWDTTRGLSEIPSALYYQGRIHLLGDGGMWTVMEAKTGERVIDRERLGLLGQSVASPVAANGHVYVFTEPGHFAVLRAGDKLEIETKGKLGESVRSTPALSGNTIYVRGSEHLWAFGSRSQDPAGKRVEYVASENVVVTTNIVFARYGDRELTLDLYEPRNRPVDPVPGIIVIHGGGWKAGDKERFAPVASRLAEAGFVAASVSYRLSYEAPFPAAVHDTKAAVRWMRANAKKYGIDEAKLGTIGGSAGAHLAMLLATSAGLPELEGRGGHESFSSAVQAAVGMATPTDFLHFESDPVREFLRVSKKDQPETWRLASPSAHVGPGDPPVLLVHCESDPVVPFSQSVLLKDRYEAVGLHAGLVAIPGERHGCWWFEPWFDETMSKSVNFFKKHLK